MLDERERRQEDHDRDGHADGRIGVDARRRGREPDDEGGHDDRQVVERIADDVEQGAEHAEVPHRRRLEGLLGGGGVAMLEVGMGYL